MANRGEKTNMGKKRKEWWQFLDWSMMRLTFEEYLSKEMQQKVLEAGYWSLGKGIFEKINSNTSFPDVVWSGSDSWQLYSTKFTGSTLNYGHLTVST